MASKYDFSTSVKVEMPKTKAKLKGLNAKLAMQEAITVGIRDGVKVLEKELKSSLDTSMNSLWSYRNGARDIVESGQLRNSLQIGSVPRNSGVTLNISYNTPYAKLIYYGGYITPYGNKNAADVLIPGRPWVEAIFKGTYGQKKFDPGTPLRKSVKLAWKTRFG